MIPDKHLEPVVISERRARPGPGRVMHAVGWGALGHGQDDPNRVRGAGSGSAMLAQNVCGQPVVVQRSQVGAGLDLRAVLQFGLEAAVAGDVIEVLLEVDHASGATGDLDHDLRYTARNPV